VTRQSKWLISAELLLIVLIIVTLIVQRDSGWDAIPIVCIYRPTLYIILIIVLIFHIVSAFIKRNDSIGRFLFKFIYLIALILVLVSTFLFPDEYMYSREIIDFNLNKQWFEEIATIAPNLSHCALPTKFSCNEVIALPQEYRRKNYEVEVVTYEKTLAIIVDSRQYVSYVHLVGQSGLPQVSLGRDKVGCDYTLSEDWYVCGIGW
jgi:hypothetical protein